MEEMLSHHTSSSATRRIARNTLMLYFRQILVMAVSLYTVRVVLNTLGAQDYGIYSVVAGVVVMFSFVGGAMATASQRYFSFALGQHDAGQLKRYFSMLFTIYCLLALALVVLMETAGRWFVEEKLVIPMERRTAALWIYQTAVFSMVCTLLTAPFIASIIAHEDMGVYAAVSVMEAALKLCASILLPVCTGDKLVLYSFLMSGVSFAIAAMYRTVCVKKYPECRLSMFWEKSLFKELLGYIGWNLFGAASGVLKNQMVNILLNQFFSPVVNAARGIAFQVNGAVNSFAQNFTTAVRPQIIKSYARGERDKMLQLVFRSCKSTFLLMYIFTLPLILEMPYILRLWLKNVPEYTVLFTKLSLIDVLMDTISYPLMAAAQATGKIQLYQAVVGGVLLLNAPITYMVLKWGGAPHSVFIVSIGITILAFAARLLILKQLIAFSLWSFLGHVVLPVLSSVAIAAIVPYLTREFMTEGLLRLCVTTAVSVASVGTSSYLIALSRSERAAIGQAIHSKLGRKEKRT